MPAIYDRAERVAKLANAITALGIPITGIRDSESGLVIHYTAAATGPQITQGNALAAGWSFAPRKPRTITALFDAITALTTAQKTNIGNDLFGASRKWSTNVGSNRSGMAVIYSQTLQGGITAANLAIYKSMGAAMYAQDNPEYLVNPTFDNSINVPGDEAA